MHIFICQQSYKAALWKLKEISAFQNPIYIILFYFIVLSDRVTFILKEGKNYIFEIEEGTTLVIHFLYLYGLGDMILT